MPTEVADELAAKLGDLPSRPPKPPPTWNRPAWTRPSTFAAVHTRRAGLLAHGDVLGYQRRVDTTWVLSLDLLCTDNPAAVALLELAAFLGPDPIPLALFTQHPDLIDEPLRTIAAGDSDALSDAVGAMMAFSLVRRHPDGFQLHRLVQAVIRNRITPPRGRTSSRQQ